jgi:hypothetical protein
MGFKLLTLSVAYEYNKFVFDHKRQGLARVLFDPVEGYKLHYLNGGVARVIYDTVEGFVASEDFLCNLTSEEVAAWVQGKDKLTLREGIIFNGDTIPEEWWKSLSSSEIEIAV